MLAADGELLVALRISSPTDADMQLIDLLKVPVESAILHWLDQEIRYKKHTELLPRPGEQVYHDSILEDFERNPSAEKVNVVSRYDVDTSLRLSNTPVFLTGLSVWEDPNSYGGQASGAFSSGTLLSEGVDYYLDVDDPTTNISESGIVERIRGSWCSEPRSIKVEYFSGLKDQTDLRGLSADLKLAYFTAFKNVFRHFDRDGASKGRGPMIARSIGRYSESFSMESISETVNINSVVEGTCDQILFHYLDMGDCL